MKTCTTDKKIPGRNGRDITITDQPSIMMVWMQIGSDVTQCLQLCSEPAGDYIGYRDGKTSLTKLALSINKDNKPVFQLILSGEGEEITRLHNFTLDQLEDMVRNMK